MSAINKLVWIDYFRQFRWRNIKGKISQGYHSMSLLFPIWIITYFPGFVFDLEKEQFFFYLTAGIPMSIGVILGMYAVIRLPKIMYMGPLSQEDRMRYLRKMWNIKLYFPSAVMVVGVVIAILWKPQAWWLSGLLILQNLMTSYSFMCMGNLSKHMNNYVVGINLSIVQFMVGAMGGLLLLYLFATLENEQMKPLMIIWGILLVIQLLIIRRLSSFKEEILEQLVCYEWICVH